jgi:hypothetical protein
MSEDARLPIRIGGLMRCCIQSYENAAPTAENTAEGDVLACAWCSSSMVVRDGAWEWNHPRRGDDIGGTVATKETTDG